MSEDGVKTVIRFLNPELKDIELAGDTKVGVNNIGFLVVTTATGDVLGVFNSNIVAGIFHPNGVAKVQIIDALIGA